MTPSAPNPAQAFLNLILQDLLSLGSQPMLTFLAAFGNAAGDPLKIEAAWIAFQGAEIGELPGFEGLLSTQIANFLAAKVKAAIPVPAA